MGNFQHFTLFEPIDRLLGRLFNPKPTGHNRWGAPCPIHGTGRNQALSIRLEADRILLHCFGGCEPEAILEALGFDGWADLYRGTESTYIPFIRNVPVQTPDEAQRAKLERIWQASRPIQSRDTVSRYLQGRSLTLGIYPTALRFHPSLEYWHTPEGQTKPTILGTYPAMIARVERSKHGLVALHRTFLTPDGHKASVPSAKKLTKPLFEGVVIGSAIRLFPVDDRLALAEGIETALAVHLATDWPVWACISAGGMARVEIPSTLREVLIAADHDAAGLEAAYALARRLAVGDVRVRVATPPKLGTDWLDVWQSEHQAVRDGR